MPKWCDLLYVAGEQRHFGRRHSGPRGPNSGALGSRYGGARLAALASHSVEPRPGTVFAPGSVRPTESNRSHKSEQMTCELASRPPPVHPHQPLPRPAANQARLA